MVDVFGHLIPLQHDERLPFFDDVRRELRSVAGAHVLHRVDRFGRDEKGLARLDRRRWLALDLILQRPFEDTDDLFAVVEVLEGRRFRADLDAVLDDLASGNAEIVPLEIGALDSRRRCWSVLLISPSVVSWLPYTDGERRAQICARRPRPPINAVT
jgi:hypothetical protein